jgi:hypothetical protein
MIDQYWYVASAFGTGALVGGSLVALAARGVMHRLVVRLTARNGLAQTAVLLETRRDSYDYGRTESVREDAGAPARVGGLTITRPGALTLYNTKGSAGEKA